MKARFAIATVVILVVGAALASALGARVSVKARAHHTFAAHVFKASHLHHSAML